MLPQCLPKVFWEPSLKVSTAIVKNPSGSHDFLAPSEDISAIKHMSLHQNDAELWVLRSESKNSSKTCSTHCSVSATALTLRLWWKFGWNEEAINSMWFLTQHVSRRAKLNWKKKVSRTFSFCLRIISWIVLTFLQSFAGAASQRILQNMPLAESVGPFCSEMQVCKHAAFLRNGTDLSKGRIKLLASQWNKQTVLRQCYLTCVTGCITNE